MPEEQAFWTFSAVYDDMLPNLISDTSAAAQPGMTMAIKSYITKKLREICPELVEHCELNSFEGLPALNLLIDTVILPLLMKLTCDEMPPYVSLRVLDLFFCEGAHVIFATVISIFL